MGMFLNYQNIADNYMPNNLINAFPNMLSTSKLYPQEASKPYEMLNTKGDLIGYFWRYGETLNLEFNLDGEITIEGDAIVLNSHGAVPQKSTVGEIGQRLYNILDLKSWTCVSIVLTANGQEYNWQEDDEFTYPLDSTRSVYISAEDYLKDKEVEVTLYNFRMEPLYSKKYNGAPVIRLVIDPELSKKLVKGIYYCSVKVFNSEVCFVVFDSTDGSLLVK